MCNKVSLSAEMLSSFHIPIIHDMPYLKLRIPIPHSISLCFTIARSGGIRLSSFFPEGRGL